MSAFREVLLALGLPLLLLLTVTWLLENRSLRLPGWLTWLVDRRGNLWVSYIVLLASVLLVRLVLSRR